MTNFDISRHLSEILGALMSAQRQLNKLQGQAEGDAVRTYMGDCIGRLAQARLDVLYLREGLNNPAALATRNSEVRERKAPPAPNAILYAPVRDDALLLDRIINLERDKEIALADLAVAQRRIEELECGA